MVEVLIKSLLNEKGTIEDTDNVLIEISNLSTEFTLRAGNSTLAQHAKRFQVD